MPCIYFLVFLLGLVPLPTLTTSEQYGGAAALDDGALSGRFHLRGSRSKFLNHPPQSTEKYLDKTSSVDAAVQETAEPEKMSEDDVQVSKFKPAAAAPAPAPSKSKRSSFDDFEEIKSEDKAAKMGEEKLEGANKFKPAGAAPAPAPSKGKRSNFFDFEEANKSPVPAPAPSKGKRSNFLDFEEKDDVKMGEEKIEESNKSPAPAPSKGKRSNFYEFEDVN